MKFAYNNRGNRVCFAKIILKVVFKVVVTTETIYKVFIYNSKQILESQNRVIE